MTRARGLAGFASAISGPVNSTDLNVGVLTATNVNVGGTITYEDVSNVDSVGIITAQAGIRVTGGSVGIGSDIPQNKLDVAGDVKILDNSPRLFFYDANANDASSATGGFEVFDKDGNKNVFVGAFAPNADNLIFGVTGSERARITSDGNLGIGTDNPGASLHIETDGADTVLQLQRTGAPAKIISSFGGGDSAFRYTVNGASSFKLGIDDSDSDRFKLSYGSADNAEFGTNDFLTVSTSGKLGIGENNPAYKLDLGDAATSEITAKLANGVDNNFILAAQNGPNNNSPGVEVFRFGMYYEGTTNDWNTYLQFIRGNGSTTGEIAFLTSQSERMSISSDGNVIFGTATPSQIVAGTANGKFFQGTDTNFISCRATSSSATHQSFFNSNGGVGSITTNASSTAFNTSSDYRLKENVVELDGAIDRVKQLAPKRFNFIADADTTVDGFLAHEAQAVVPEAITGTHNEVDENGDPVYQVIDQSKLVPLLTGALQEAIAKIETLETKVAALEGN